MLYKQHSCTASSINDILEACAGFKPPQQSYSPQSHSGGSSFCRLCSAYGHATSECPSVAAAVHDQPDTQSMQLDPALMDELDDDFWTAEPSLQVKVSLVQCACMRISQMAHTHARKPIDHFCSS